MCVIILWFHSSFSKYCQITQKKQENQFSSYVYICIWSNFVESLPKLAVEKGDNFPQSRIFLPKTIALLPTCILELLSSRKKKKCSSWSMKNSHFHIWLKFIIIMHCSVLQPVFGQLKINWEIEYWSSFYAFNTFVICVWIA